MFSYRCTDINSMAANLTRLTGEKNQQSINPVVCDLVCLWLVYCFIEIKIRLLWQTTSKLKEVIRLGSFNKATAQA